MTNVSNQNCSGSECDIIESSIKNQHFQIPIPAWKVSPISARALNTFDT